MQNSNKVDGFELELNANVNKRDIWLSKKINEKEKNVRNTPLPNHRLFFFILLPPPAPVFEPAYIPAFIFVFMTVIESSSPSSPFA